MTCPSCRDEGSLVPVTSPCGRTYQVCCSCDWGINECTEGNCDHPLVKTPNIRESNTLASSFNGIYDSLATLRHLTGATTVSVYKGSLAWDLMESIHDDLDRISKVLFGSDGSIG